MATYPAMPILVAEDDRTTVQIIRNLLRRIGFRDIDDAPDGSAALVKMKEKRYELVIADWNMEPMTGYELLKQVRADPGFANTRFILITVETLKLKIDAAFLV